MIRGCSRSEWNPSLSKNKQTSRYIYRTYSFVCGAGIGDKSKRWNRFSGEEAPGNPLFVLPAGQISYSLLSIQDEDHCGCSISLPRACLHGEYHTIMLVHPFPLCYNPFFEDSYSFSGIAFCSYKDFRFWSYLLTCCSIVELIFLIILKNNHSLFN